MEEWRQLPGEPGYEVSSLGRVRRIVAPATARDACGYVVLSVRGKRRYLHHLVALAFHGPRPERAQIRHLDGDQENNAAANLAYGTTKENAADKSRHGRHPTGNWRKIAPGIVGPPPEDSV